MDGNDAQIKMEEAIRVAVIGHLSKEIECMTTYLMNFRTKIAFGFWTGPFILLGSVVYATTRPGTSHVTWEQFPWKFISAGLIFCYVALGGVGGGIEGQAWDKIDTWRLCIAKISTSDSLKESELYELMQHAKLGTNAIKGYIIAFFIMATSLCLLLWLLFPVFNSLNSSESENMPSSSMKQQSVRTPGLRVHHK